ncbi:MAG: DUF1641 domain-containing protein [Calditrichia bacterium]|nr:DUF1641 domain-containing protein [Calditrichia bacterium]
MENANISKQLEDINQKLNIISQQMLESQKRQKEFEELKDDMSIIGKDMFNAAVEELEDVAPYFDTKDLIYLVKKLLRNTRNLNTMLTQMEGAADLFTDLKPLGKQMFDELMDSLNEMDRKGYFEFFSEAIKIVDTVVTSFSVDDVKLLKDDIVSILMTIKNITQPEMLSSVNNALGFFQKMDIDVQEDISYFALLKQLKDPEVKRGLSFMLEFVKNMAGSTNNNQVQTQ